MRKKLILIDGNSLLFRAYYATANTAQSIMTNKEGYPTNAVFAFANMINKIVNQMKPGDHILVAFDTGKKTFRSELFKEYKANRASAPEQLIQQFPLARAFLDAMGIYRYEIDGYEADDILGTVSRIASERNYQIDVYTSDKDYLQLVDKNTTVCLIRKGLSDIHEMTPEKVVEVYGYPPEKVVEFKGLRGDPSDNLPGIPGIGEKTAVKLINDYGTLENIIQALPILSKKTAESIENNAELGLLSRKLAMIDRYVPIDFEIDDLKYDGFDFVKINTFGQKYELRQFLSRLPSKWKRFNPLESDFDVNIINSLKDIDLGREIGFAIDIVNDDQYFKNDVYGFALTDGKLVYYINLADALKDDTFINYLKDENIKKYVYNTKQIEVALHKYGLELKGIAMDLLLAAYVIDSGLNTTDIVSVMASFGIDVSSSDDNDFSLFGESDIKQTAKIAVATYGLKERIIKELNSIKASDLYFNIELPLSHVLAKMEIEGFPLNVNKLDEFGDEYKEKIIVLEKQIHNMVGEKFNISSPKQLAEILFNKLDLPDKRGKSTSIDVLRELIPFHPVISKIIEYRKYTKINSTYIEGFKPHVHSDGKIHALFNQAQTATGRLSSSSPNLQNISVRDEDGKRIRQAFYYDDENYSILSLDYSQIEIRILAALSGCKKLIDVFKNELDIHESTAKQVFHKDTITEDDRRKAKAVNFGIIYGISDWGLSEQIGASLTEAKYIIDSFFDSFPEVAHFLHKVVVDATDNGYVSTLFGRRRYLRDFNSSNYQTREFAKRAAMNAPIQGTAADLIKIAMIKVDKLLTEGNYKTKMVLQIHDELIFKIHKDEEETLIPLIKQVMEDVENIGVPLLVEGGVGKTFFDAK